MKGKSTMISLDKEQIDTLKKAKVVIDFILEHENITYGPKPNEETHDKPTESMSWERYPIILKIFDHPQNATISDLNKASWAIRQHGFGWDDIHDFYEMCWRNGVPIKLVQSSCNYQRKHLFADDKKKNELFS